MASRQELHRILEAIPGITKVYFQPPESIKLEYPCIVYKLSEINTQHADNSAYFNKKAYDVQLISREPNFQIVDALNELPYCRMARYFSSNNLNHYNYKLYF